MFNRVLVDNEKIHPVKQQSLEHRIDACSHQFIITGLIVGMFYLALYLVRHLFYNVSLYD